GCVPCMAVLRRWADVEEDELAARGDYPETSWQCHTQVFDTDLRHVPSGGQFARQRHPGTEALVVWHGEDFVFAPGYPVPALELLVVGVGERAAILIAVGHGPEGDVPYFECQVEAGADDEHALAEGDVAWQAHDDLPGVGIVALARYEPATGERPYFLEHGPCQV